MTILPPASPTNACRCCETAGFRLDGDGFCRQCAAHIQTASVVRHGVGFDWCMVLFPDRALPFFLTAWVFDRAAAERHFPCIDLPFLEETAVDLWRTDKSYRSEIIETIQALAGEAVRRVQSGRQIHARL